MKAFVQHQVISASAGSGKTFRLSSRYIQLLAAGVDPATIVALTFTRKAAAEIFDRIMQRLAQAALRPEALKQLNESTGLLLSSEEVLHLLQRLIRAMPMLRIGTLDSFLARIVRLFAFELGIQGEFSILEGFPLEEARQAALLKTLDGNLPEKNKQAFLYDFKQATFGREERSVFQKLQKFIKDFQPFYQAAPDGSCWGNPARIWPGGQPLLDGAAVSRTDYEAALDILCAAAFDEPWIKFTDILRGFDGHRLPDQESSLIKQLLDQCGAWSKNDAELTYRKRAYPLTAAHRDALDVVVRHLFQCIMNGQCRRTQGIYQVLSRYEQVYSETVRRAGRISFQDMVEILAAGGLQSRVARRLTQQPVEGSDHLLYIDYRLDGRFDHWMLDEFQDTSTAQWRVLSNLIDEVLQDPEGERSFFYVGDVKQAIYAWRGGDARLFMRVCNRYRAVIERETLSVSRRSAPAVIHTVNGVFSNLTPEERLPESAVARWNETWETHQTVRDDAPGYAALIELPRPDRAARNEDDPRFVLTAELLAPLLENPPPRGIAVLVRSSNTGRAIVDFLRAHSIDTQWEGDSEIADNTVISALLALLKLAEHPGDNLAWEHVNMTPLRDVMQSFKLDRDTLSAQLLRDMHLYGFQHILRRWLTACGQLHPNGFSAFTRARLTQLLQCAQEFDLTQPRQVVPFIRFIQNTSGKADAPSGAVRVLTIHKAKGLEFDAVFLPDLQAQAMDALGHGEIGITLHTDSAQADNPPDWVLYYPPKRFAEQDPQLAANLREMREQQAYESLCLLYVAMTRARQALYLITLEPGKTSTTLYASTLLKKQLAGKSAPSSDPRILYDTGDAEWFKREASVCEEPSVPAITPVAELPCAPIRLERRLPSAEADAHILAEHLFSTRGRGAAEYGTAMHALFEQIEWYEPGAESACIMLLQNMPLDEEMKGQLRLEFSRALSSPAVCGALARPAQPAVLWREKRFEIALGTRWISGCFDRVTILLDAAGNPASAAILDYKTDHFPDTEEDFARAVDSHREQLALYRDVLAVMTGLAPERIALQLLFTRPARLQSISGDQAPELQIH